MGFGKMMELLQEKNKGKIVLCNCGNFYIATGKDAIVLYESLNLQLSCFKQEICKVGFPISIIGKIYRYDTRKRIWLHSLLL